MAAINSIVGVRYAFTMQEAGEDVDFLREGLRRLVQFQRWPKDYTSGSLQFRVVVIFQRCSRSEMAFVAESVGMRETFGWSVA